MDESIILMKLLDLTVKQDWEKKKKNCWVESNDYYQGDSCTKIESF